MLLTADFVYGEAHSHSRC